ncbi:hypothetical protein MASR2M8_02760 [Opitutaceae bacterium]
MTISLSPLRVTAVLALTALVGLQSGCLVVAAGAAGAGTVAYIRGGLEASLSGSHAAVIAATNKAVSDLKFARISESQDALTATIIARTADDKKIEIKVVRVSDTLSKVEIRVGIFGDEFVSISILDRIKANL